MIEINSAAGLDNYARMGAHQKGRVLDLYTQALIDMERREEVFAPNAQNTLKI